MLYIFLKKGSAEIKFSENRCQVELSTELIVIKLDEILQSFNYNKTNNQFTKGDIQYYCCGDKEHYSRNFR